MGGLARICRAYGGMTVKGNDGTTINYVWDYVAEEAVPDTEMPRESARRKASDRRFAEMLKAERLAESRRQAGAPAGREGGRDAGRPAETDQAPDGEAGGDRDE